MNRLNRWLTMLTLLSVTGCWWWHPHHPGGGSGGSGGAGGSAGSGGSGGSGAQCSTTDQFLLVTEEISGDCGAIDDEVVTTGDPGWTDPNFDQPCVISGCSITCDRTYDTATFDVEQTLDLELGDATFDNPMEICQTDTGPNPYQCCSDYLIDVTRVNSSQRRLPAMSSGVPARRRMSVLSPQHPAGVL
jgi:hypothetical protein